MHSSGLFKQLHLTGHHHLHIINKSNEKKIVHVKIRHFMIGIWFWGKQYPSNFFTYANKTHFAHLLISSIILLKAKFLSRKESSEKHRTECIYQSINLSQPSYQILSTVWILFSNSFY